MKTQNNQTASDAAMKTTNYRLTPETAGILDCIRANDALFSMIVNAMSYTHEAGEVDAEAEKYLAHTNAIAELLHKEMIRQICGNMSDAGTDNDGQINI